MALDIDEFIVKFDELTNNIGAALPDITQTAALGAIALIKGRVQEKGENPDGQSYGGYSETEVPAFFYYNKATNESGRKIIKDRQKEKRGLSYKDFKAANNGEESVRVKNFTFTGDMWRNTNIISTGFDGNFKYKVEVGGKTDFAADKLEWNTERDGDILNVSEQEEKIITETSQEEVDRIIKSSGF